MEFYYEINDKEYILLKLLNKDIYLKLLMSLIISDEFYYICKSEEFSLILSKSYLDNFLENDKELKKIYSEYMVIDPTIYNYVDIQTYGCGISECGIIKKISDLFSKNKISILIVSNFTSNIVFYSKDIDIDCVLSSIN